MQELQTKKEWLEERVMPNLIVAMIAAFWVALFAGSLAFGVGLFLSTFQRSVGLSIVAFFVAFPITSKLVARWSWKQVLKDAETKTFKAE